MKPGTSAKILLVCCLAVVSLGLSGFAPAPVAPRLVNVSVERFAYEPAKVSPKGGKPVVYVALTFSMMVILPLAAARWGGSPQQDLPSLGSRDD